MYRVRVNRIRVYRVVRVNRVGLGNIWSGYIGSEYIQLDERVPILAIVLDLRKYRSIIR